MEGHLKPLPIPFEETRINTEKLLLANGCKLETKNSQGRAPLESALDDGLPRNTAYLLDAGALSSGEDVWETLRGSYPITLCDGSGLATFVALVNHHKEKDPSFVVSALFWLLGQEHAVNSNRQIFGELIRWLVAKEANPPLMNETDFCKACVVAASRGYDMESLDIFTHSQLCPPPHELEQLIDPTSVRRDENLMMAFLVSTGSPGRIYHRRPSTIAFLFSLTDTLQETNSRLRTMLETGFPQSHSKGCDTCFGLSWV